MDANSIISALRRHDPFDRLEPHEIAQLAGTVTAQTYRRGLPILVPDGHTADRFFVVLEGLVEVAPLPGDDDSDEVAWDLRPGDCFPVGALVSKSAVSSTYTAAEDTRCCLIPATAFDALVQSSAPFRDYWLRRTAQVLDHFREALRFRRSQHNAGYGTLDQPLARVLRRDPVTCRPDTTLTAALQTMQRERIGAMIVVDAARSPLGIFTLHDVLDRVALPQASLALPISEVMSTDLTVLPGTASAQDAALAMVRHGIRHVLVVDDGSVQGIVSENDLFSLQRLGMRELSSTIARTDELARLVPLGRDVERLARAMLSQGMAAERLTEFIATVNDALTARIVQVSQTDFGLHPVRYCWIALGSEGRHEQTFASDQDNGLIFVAPPSWTARQTREHLLPWAQRINRVLDAAGYALCKGNIMAGNPAWCLSLEEWKERFARWIESGNPQALLNAAIFFDFRALHGEAELATALREWLNGYIVGYPRFLHQMARNALRTRPPLGVFRDFVLDGPGEQRNTVDLKLNGAGPFVDAARIYALQCRVSTTNTVARLREISKALGVPQAQAEAWTRSYLFIQLTRLRHQEARRERGEQMNNRIDPYALNELDRLTLKEAFRQARKLQTRLALDYQL